MRAVMSHVAELQVTAGAGVSGDPDEQARAVVRVAGALAGAELNRRAGPDRRGPRLPDPGRADGDRQLLTPGR